MALGRRLLVDADPAYNPRLHACSTTRDHPLRQPPRLFSTHPQDLRGAAGIALVQHVDGEALEQQREPRLRPPHLELGHTVFTTCPPVGYAHAGGSGTIKCLDAARSAPRRDRTTAASWYSGARPRRGFWVFVPYVYALPFDIHVHAAHFPRRLQAQEVLIERGGLDGRSLLGQSYCPSSLPMGNPEAPNNSNDT